MNAKTLSYCHKQYRQNIYSLIHLYPRAWGTRKKGGDPCWLGCLSGKTGSATYPNHLLPSQKNVFQKGPNSFFVPGQQLINHRIKSLKAISIVFFRSELALLIPCGNLLVKSIDAPQPSQIIFDFSCLIVSIETLEHLGH